MCYGCGVDADACAVADGSGTPGGLLGTGGAGVMESPLLILAE
jgi:hypothetical protein